MGHLDPTGTKSKYNNNNSKTQKLSLQHGPLYMTNKDNFNVYKTTLLSCCRMSRLPDIPSMAADADTF